MHNLFSDPEYLSYIEEFITENRKNNFDRVLQNRTKHITIAVEDVFQLHNTSAVMAFKIFTLSKLNLEKTSIKKSL